MAMRACVEMFYVGTRFKLDAGSISGVRRREKAEIVSGHYIIPYNIFYLDEQDCHQRTIKTYVLKHTRLI